MRRAAVLLRADDLTVQKGDMTILKNVSLQVQAGEILAIIGPNGCGKTTLAMTLMGLSGYQPTTGRIALSGHDITESPVYERARNGLVLAWQEPARFEGIGVRKFLELGPHSNGDEVQEEGLKQALLEVGLSPERYLDRMVDDTLSGGERKRIELASIRLMDPKVVIFDEPDSGVDVVAMKNIDSMIAKLAQEDRGILLITHSEEILKNADRAALLCNGEIIREGSVSEVGEYFRNQCIPCPEEQYVEEVAQ